jgi:phosphoenolpyruvate carboxylase
MSKVITIDPGKSKCGLVLAEISEKKVYKAIILKSEFIEDYFKDLNNVEDISKIIIGNGTSSREIIQKLSFLKGNNNF